MKTSEQWWKETLANEELLINWLKNQYHGERTAAQKIYKLFVHDNPDVSPSDLTILKSIIRDEELHADWIGNLLLPYGVTPEILKKEERYWNQVLKDSDDKSTQELAAIAHHAEVMRLQRIRAIIGNLDTPEPNLDYLLKSFLWRLDTLDYLLK